MNKSLHYILSILTSLWLSNHVLAQDEIAPIALDSSAITIQNFNDPLAEHYNGEEFEYDRAEGEAENLLARALNWFFKGLQSIFGIDVNPNLLKVIENIIYILLIVLAVYILVRILAGKDAVSFFGKKNTTVAPVTISEEQIENINLDELITEALTKKDFRLAIRYMYLKALQELTLKNIIEYHFEKTNTDYYTEIADITIKQYYNRISYLYDYIWYGEFDLDEAGYQKAKTSFDQLHTKLNTVG